MRFRGRVQDDKGRRYRVRMQVEPEPEEPTEPEEPDKPVPEPPIEPPEDRVPRAHDRNFKMTGIE